MSKMTLEEMVDFYKNRPEVHISEPDNNGPKLAELTENLGGFPEFLDKPEISKLSIPLR